jgi:oxaloacetate decarboxylase alpha subunit
MPTAISQTATAPPQGDIVEAIFAGNVFRVLAKAGDVVSQGQPVLTVEAMKMETEVSAPKAGRLSEIFVREGDFVAIGDSLFAIA